MARNSATRPRYYQILVDLRSKIEGGQIAPGERLPTEKELMERYGVSRVTVRRALEELCARGFTEHRGKKGHYVIADQEADENRLTDNNLFAHAQIMGKRLTTSLLSQGVIGAPDDAAPFLGVEIGEPVFEVNCLHAVDGTPFGLERIIMPAAFAPKVNLEKLQNTPLIELLKLDCGFRPAYSTQTLSPQMPTVIEAGALKLGSRRPLLMVSSRTYDTNGQPMVFSELLCNTDVMDYTITWTKR